MTRPSLEQAVAQALAKLLWEICDGVNNPKADEVAEVLAARVAAAIEAGIRGNKDGLMADGEHCSDCIESATADALRALTQQEKP